MSQPVRGSLSDEMFQLGFKTEYQGEREKEREWGWGERIRGVCNRGIVREINSIIYKEGTNRGTNRE